MEALDRILKQINLKDSLSQSQKPLKESSIPQTSYKCMDCKDTGMIVIPQENTQPIMKRCKCQEKEIAERQWKAAGLNPSTSTQTLANFEDWNVSSKKAKTTAITYLKEFDGIKSSRKNSIMFCGQVGSGKTHLSVALALNLLQKGIKVVYMPYRDTITAIKQNMLDEEFYKKQIGKYQSAEVLLMDDLFKGKVNESDINIMFEIVNYRYINMLPVIVSTEFTTEQLLSFDEAVGSRIYEMCKDYIVQIEKNIKNNYRLR